MMKFKDIFSLIKETFRQWSEVKAERLAAALSYYTIFSLAPLLIIVIVIAGFILGSQADVQARIIAQAEGLVGSEGAQAIQAMVEGANDPGGGIFATVISVVVLVFGATGVFAVLHDSLNTIWGVKQKPGGGLWNLIRTRFLSFSMVLGIGFLLLVSLVVSAALSALGTFMVGLVPGFEVIMQVISFLVSLAVITLLFAMIFKFLPDAKIAWRDVWLGALVTSILFTIGKELIGLYLGRGAITSTYGAVASLVIIILWVYYSGQILFFGAEFTQVYANRFGSQIEPSENAVELTEEDRIKRGIPTKETLAAIAAQDERQRQAERTWQPRTADPTWAEPEIKAGLLQPARTPAQKSMAALSGLVAALLGFISLSFIRGRKS